MRSRPALPTLAALTAMTALTVAFAATPLARADGGADAIVGVWETAHTDKGYAHIEMTRDGDAYAGAIVWLNEPNYPADDEMAGQPKIDRMNPDHALRQRPIIGLRIVNGLRFAGDGSWEDGTIYDPESGKTYRSKAWIADSGEKLNLRGYIGISLFGRTSEWKRVHAEPGS